LKVFCDFDGTITEKDVCVEVCKEFGDYDKYYPEVKSGAYGLKTFWKNQVKEFRFGLNEQVVLDFVNRFDVDAYVIEFFHYLSSEQIPAMIISDGFSIYIKDILERAGLSNIPFKTNNLIFSDGTTDIVYPGASESCNCIAASCKRNAVLANSAEEDIIVFIGDGISDFCVAKYADIIFARKSLAAYCTENKIPHYHYKTFFDIKLKFIDIIKNGKLKQRNDAFVNRKNAVEAE